MLMCRVIADAVEEGRFIASRRHGNGAGPALSRSEEQEAEVAAEQAEARRQAALAAQEREARVAARTTGPGEQSAVENATLADPVATDPGLSPENAQNLLDDATAADQAGAAAEAASTPPVHPRCHPAEEPAESGEAVAAAEEA